MAPHGADPVGFAIVTIGAIVTAWVFFFAIRVTIRPGEDDPAHVKCLILREDR